MAMIIFPAMLIFFSEWTAISGAELGRSLEQKERARPTSYMYIYIYEVVVQVALHRRRSR